MPFIDRPQAGRKLAAKLANYEKQLPVILALPRGGVPVAAEVAAALSAPLDPRALTTPSSKPFATRSLRKSNAGDGAIWVAGRERRSPAVPPLSSTME